MLITLYKISEVAFACLAGVAFTQRPRMKNVLLRVRVVVRTLHMNISRRCLADRLRQKCCSKKRAPRAARLFFLIQPIKSLICSVVEAVAVVVP